MHELFRFLEKFFLWFGKQKAKFNSIRNNEEQRKKSQHFGVRSLLFIIFGFTLSAITFFFGLKLVTANADGILVVFFSVVLGIILVVSGGLLMLAMFIYSLASSILQLKMNRRIIGFISLFFCLAVTVGALYLGLIIMDNVF